MAVSNRTTNALPLGIWGPGADGMGRVMVPSTPPIQTNAHDEEIPVATYERTEEGTKQKGNQETTQSQAQADDEESLPSSSPLSFSSVETATPIAEDKQTEEVSPGKRSESASLWDALSPFPRRIPGPGETLFDGYESAPLEDGEVEDEDVAVRTPPSNQEAKGWSDENRRRTRDSYDFTGERSGPHFELDSVPTGRKRTWVGSPASEEASRTARRPRREAGTPSDGELRLPPIHEMLGNPWRTGDGVSSRVGSFRPVVSSTPKRKYATNFVPDSAANVSEIPPTPFSAVSLVSNHSSARSTSQPTNGEREAMGRTPRSRDERDGDDDTPADAADMDVDLDDSELLQPRGRTHRRNEENHRLRGRAWSQGKGPRSLYDIIGGTGVDDDESHHGEREQRWKGGYAPRLWSQGEVGSDGTARRRAADDWEEEQYETRAGSRTKEKTPFSAIPHTRAWQFRTDRTRITLGANPGRQTRSQDEDDDAWEADEPRMADASAREWGDDLRQEESRNTGRTGEPDDREDEWQGYSGATPTALTHRQDEEDRPVVVKDPKSSKWRVHFGDPEFALTGLDGQWISTIWNDDSPVVVFWVYNYKYTDNGIINRHIETS
ncbi:hypothetical protein OH76DRAFT_1422850, partial [Lentinus brumalis]